MVIITPKPIASTSAVTSPTHSPVIAGLVGRGAASVSKAIEHPVRAESLRLKTLRVLRMACDISG
jgi:hypothetical protein